LVACYISRETTAPDRGSRLLILGLNDAEVVGGVGTVSLESAEPHMGAPSIRVLVVEDYEPWRHFISTMLQKQPELESSGQALDGLEAVQQAKEQQPDLILLDIGLPTISGIEAARRIREVSPASKILFVSETRSPEIAEEALNTGAGGYVLKSDAASELLPAIKAVLQGKRFVSASLAGHFLVATTVSTTQTNLLTSMVTLISGIR
jgi:DNA-binding NarL/FixJ family response regulator